MKQITVRNIKELREKRKKIKGILSDIKINNKGEYVCFFSY